MAEIDLCSPLLLGESHGFGVMLIAQLNVKFLLTKEGKDGGCGWDGVEGGGLQPRTEAEG